MNEKTIWEVYEKQMNQITIDKKQLKQNVLQMKEGIPIRRRKMNKRYIWRVACCICLIVVTLAGSGYLRSMNHNIDMVVYASDGTTQKLSKNQPVILASKSHIYSTTYVSEQEIQETFELNLSCTGEDIQSVTYSLVREQNAEDGENVVADKGKATAWLSKVQTSTSNEDSIIEEEIEYDGATEEIIGSSENGENQNLTAMEMSYTVKAGEEPKNNILQYLISKNEEGVYEREDIFINASIQLENGNKIIQRVRIHVVPFTEAGEAHQVEVYVK